jgi:hypothetical protein
MLIFLTGEEEIEDACRKITREVQNLGDQANPLKLFLYIQPFLHPCKIIYLTQLHVVGKFLYRQVNILLDLIPLLPRQKYVNIEH